MGNRLVTTLLACVIATISQLQYVEDNCSAVANADQGDSDGDGIGDVYDACIRNSNF